jgi:hypothetical protein
MKCDTISINNPLLVYIIESIFKEVVKFPINIKENNVIINKEIKYSTQTITPKGQFDNQQQL